MTASAFRASLVSAFRRALASLDPAELVRRALGPLPDGRVSVIAAGKAAHRMADGVALAYPDLACETLVVGPDGDAHLAGGADARHRRHWTLHRAAHPTPDERSLAAGAEALRRARALRADDRLVALISGGASSLLAALPPGMTLDAKRRIVRALLERGAPITDVNTVRRHLSPIKGGGLAEAAAPASVVCLVLSDVIAGALSDIASGPAVADPSTRDDACACIERWIPEERAALEPFLRETLAPGALPSLEARILADPAALGRAVGAALTEDLGLRVTLGPPEARELEDAVRRRVDSARDLGPGEAMVVPCEPTVALPSQRGRGGRAGRAALSALPHLPADVFLLCAASDGVDGSSGAAGAVVCGRDATTGNADERARALADFDDAAAHRSMGTTLDLEPTGTNLTDVHVLARPGG